MCGNFGKFGNNVQEKPKVPRQTGKPKDSSKLVELTDFLLLYFKIFSTVWASFIFALILLKIRVFDGNHKEFDLKLTL